MSENIQTNVVSENILENVSSNELSGMIRNALRFYNKINHNIEDNMEYELKTKFVMDKNNVGINGLNIQKVNINIGIDETPISEKYDEYNTLIHSPEMNRKTLGDVIKRKISDTKIDLMRKNAKVPLM